MLLCSALKRLVALMILVCEYYVLNKTSSVGIWCSVGVMVSGIVLFSFRFVSFIRLTYFFML